MTSTLNPAQSIQARITGIDDFVILEIETDKGLPFDPASVVQSSVTVVTKSSTVFCFATCSSLFMQFPARKF